MTALVICQICGRTISNVRKESFSEMEMNELELTSACEEHGPNLYERDEDGVILAQTSFVVKAIKKAD